MCEHDELTSKGQMVAMASTIGLTRSEFTVVSPDDHERAIRISRAYAARPTRDVGPYSANGIFDTGSEVLYSGVPKLFFNLTPRHSACHCTSRASKTP